MLAYLAMCDAQIRPLKRKDAFTRDDVRRGMVLVDSIDTLRPSFSFTAEVSSSFGTHALIRECFLHDVFLSPFFSTSIYRDQPMYVSSSRLLALRLAIMQVLVLTHHTTIKPKYQPVVHCGNVRQVEFSAFAWRTCQK